MFTACHLVCGNAGVHDVVPFPVCSRPRMAEGLLGAMTVHMYILGSTVSQQSTANFSGF